MPTPGEVRINGLVFINDKPAGTLKPQPPVIYQPRDAGGATTPVPKPNGKQPIKNGKRRTRSGVSAPVGKGAQGRLQRAQYWSDPARAKQYNAQYHGRMALNSHGTSVPEYTDCGRFVHSIVQQDDPHYPAVGTGIQEDYIEQNWTHGAIGEGDGPQPGDVLIVHNRHHGHTAIYKGPGPNGTYEVYNASLGGHGPDVSSFRPSFFEIWGRPK